jgi:hypothetical protein
MIGNKAGSKGTTNTRTRIHTMLINASLIPWALYIYNAFRFALYIWIANVVLNTFARCSFSVF